MTRYIIQRLLFAVPTLLLISVLAFWMGQGAIGDPLSLRGAVPYTAPSLDPKQESLHYLRQAEQFELDKPLFYFSVLPDCYPDTLHRVFPYYRRVRMKEMALAVGSWGLVCAYEEQLAVTVQEFERVYDKLGASPLLYSAFADLLRSEDYSTSIQRLDSLSLLVQDSTVRLGLDTLRERLAVLAPAGGWGWPKWYWHGIDNQYHNWLVGDNKADRGSPWEQIRYSLRVTILINSVALILALILGIPVGVWLAAPGREWVNRAGRLVLVTSYVIPVLLVACAMRYLFATPGHGFDTTFIGGVGTSMYDPSRHTFFSWAGLNWSRLILPVFTLWIHYMALIALQMRSGVLSVFREDYIRTARSKGIGERKVLWRHAVPNALFPVITIMGGLLPGAVSGSVITESVFNINGLGHATVDAVLTGNYPIMMSIVLLTAVLTIIGNILVDVAYAWIDPRIRVSNRA